MELKIPYREALAILEKHIEEGDEIQSHLEMGYSSDQKCRENFNEWYSDTGYDLKRIFKTHSHFLKFKRAVQATARLSLSSKSIGKTVLLKGLKKGLDVLMAICDKLPDREREMVCPIEFNTSTGEVRINGEHIGMISTKTHRSFLLRTLESFFPKKVECFYMMDKVPNLINNYKYQKEEGAARMCTEWKRQLIRECPKLKDYLHQEKGCIRIRPLEQF